MSTFSPGRRRDFLKLLSTGVGGLIVGVPACAGCRAPLTDAGDALFEAFQSPSAEARPFLGPVRLSRRGPEPEGEAE